MKNIDLLPVDSAVKAQIRTARDKFLGYTGIQVDILEVDGDTIRIRVKQVEARNHIILSQAELTKRAGDIVAPLRGNFKLHYVPLTFEPDLEVVTGEWIKSTMEDLNLKRNDVMKHLGIEGDKSTFSKMLSGSLNLTRLNKAAFYYYFATFEMGRDFREYMDLVEEEAAQAPPLDGAVVEVPEMLDASASVAFAETMRDVPSSAGTLTLNFRKCQYISSAGLGVIIQNSERFKKIKIRNVRESIWNVFTVLGFDLMYDLEPPMK